MALPQSISGEFGMRAEGADVFNDSAFDAANDPLMSSTVRPDLLQTIQPQVVADPNQPAANSPQMTAKQEQAVKQYQDLTTKTPSGLGAALSAGSSAEAGAARQDSAQKAATQMASKATELQKVISGAAEPKQQPSMAGKVAGVAMGQGLNMAAAGAATVVAGPIAGAAVAATGLAYDVVKAFSGQSDGPSSFGTRDSKGEMSSYGVSSSAQPAAPANPASTGFNSFMSNIPGERNPVDDGMIETTSAGLKGIEKAPKLEMTPAALALQGVFRNGQEAAAGKDGPAADQNDNLSFQPPKMPNPGVFQAAAPKPFFG